MTDFKLPKSRVYILLDGNDRVTRIEGEYSLPSDLTGWLQIDDGDPCDRLNLAQSHYLDGGLYTQDGLLRWKYERGKCVLRTDEELEADRKLVPEPAPTQLDRVEAQVTFTAMMTDTLLEE